MLGAMRRYCPVACLAYVDRPSFQWPSAIPSLGHLFGGGHLTDAISPSHWMGHRAKILTDLCPEHAFMPLDCARLHAPRRGAHHPAHCVSTSRLGQLRSAYSYFLSTASSHATRSSLQLLVLGVSQRPALCATRLGSTHTRGTLP